MTTARKIKSNRANARLSTGPNTAQGKARAARNARRHGLSVLIFNDPERSADIDDLAFSIAGEGAKPDIMELARNIARAQIELARVRNAQHDLLSRDFDDPKLITDKFFKEFAKVTAKALLTSGPDPVLPPALAQFADRAFHSKPEGAKKIAYLMLDFGKQLRVLDRYERRALSRRKFAIRAFDRAIREAAVAASTDT